MIINHLIREDFAVFGYVGASIGRRRSNEFYKIMGVFISQMGFEPWTISQQVNIP